VSKNLSNAERQAILRARREVEGKHYFRRWVPIKDLATIEWFIEFLDSGEFTLEWVRERLR